MSTCSAARVGLPLALYAALSVALSFGCGARPPTLAEQGARWSAATTADGRARHGWFRWLQGDVPGAEAAWADNSAPLAALGRSRLAFDRLDAAGALRAGGEAAQGPGRVGLLGAAMARRAAARLPDGAAQLADALGPATERRAALTDARHTLRVSFLPRLDRARIEAEPPRLDDDGDRVRALGSWWALSEDAPEPDRDGLVITTWPLPDGPAHIELKVEGPVVAWRGGVKVAGTAPDRPAPSRLRFTAPGTGPLWVAWAADRVPRAWRLDAAAPAARPAETDDAVERLLGAELALYDGDAAAAGRWLAGQPDTAAFAVSRARLAQLEPGVPGTLSRDRARAAWTAAAPIAPARSALELARIARRGGDVDTARTRLDAASSLAPDAWVVHRERVRLYTNLGFVEEALAALDAAETLAPDPCELVDDRAALLGDRPAGVEDALVDAFERCERPLDAVDRLLALSRPAAALARLEQLGSERARARRLTGRALIALGRLEDAARVMPTDEIDDAMVAADLTVAAEPTDAAHLEGTLRQLMVDFPTAREALTMVATWPAWSTFADLRFATDAVVAEYESRPELPGPAVRVLDHSAIVYFADGTSLRWVHEVLAIRSREAAEEFGELSLPGDEVLPVAIYTRKADGRRLYAEQIPEKDSLSLPDLADGDYVVAVYLEPGDNGYLYDSGYLTPRVYFRGADMPIFRQTFQVFGPDDTPPAAQRLGDAPEGQPVKLGERAGLRFDRRSTPVRVPEGDPVPAGLWLPSIRAGQAVSLADDLAFYRDRVLARRRRTAAFDAWVAERAGDGEPAERIARLVRTVRTDVDGQSGLIGRGVSPAMHDGQGNRALVLSAVLEAAGIGHRLILARPAVHVPSGPFRTVADFPYALIHVDGGPWIDPGPDRAGVGWVPFPMLGGDGLVVWPPDGPSEPVALPSRRPITDHRVVEVEAHWGEDGVVRGTVVDRLSGQEASVIGRYLSRLDPEMRPRLVERLLLHAFPAGRVIAFEDVTDADPDGPLELRYTFEVEAGERLRVGVFPVRPAHRYAQEDDRTIPLSIDLPTFQRVTMELTSDRDFTADVRQGETRWQGAAYRLAVDVDDDELEVESLLVVPGGPVAPEDYAAFAEWARGVDRMERITLVVEAPTAAR